MGQEGEEASQKVRAISLHDPNERLLFLQVSGKNTRFRFTNRALVTQSQKVDHVLIKDQGFLLVFEPNGLLEHAPPNLISETGNHSALESARSALPNREPRRLAHPPHRTDRT